VDHARNTLAITRPTIVFHRQRLLSDRDFLTNTGNVSISEVLRRYLCYYGTLDDPIRKQALDRLCYNHILARYPGIDAVGAYRSLVAADRLATVAGYVINRALSRHVEEASVIGSSAVPATRQSTQRLLNSVANSVGDTTLSQSMAPLIAAAKAASHDLGNPVHRLQIYSPAEGPLQGRVLHFQPGRDHRDGRIPIATLGIPYLSPKDKFSYYAQRRSVKQMVTRKRVSREEMSALEKAVVLEEMFVW